MTATPIYGKDIALKIRAEVAAEVAQREKLGKAIPGLATLLVGENPASMIYVASKHRACKEVGMNSFDHRLPANATNDEVKALVGKLNADPRVHAILVQLPLPSGLDEENALSTVSIEKDVDGLHPVNVGRLAQKGRDPLFYACTPSGIIYLLKGVLPKLEGLRAVVLGRSNIVGMPVSLMLLRENATVTVCHSRSRSLPDIIRGADVLVAAVGVPGLVRGDWLKPGVTVIDAGLTRVDDPADPRGYRLAGDVNYTEAIEVAGAITPVPGGVGPLTIAMLLKNTLRAAKLSDM
jgi:5,10-methylene-tetrahydrofolate dehydrogenase/methenyl tetrahydrofolate cyclohydrolase